MPLASSQSNEALIVDSVGYVYDPKTPWAHQALADVSLTIEPGSRVLIVGENGSGKSTLAWILAGLFRPTFGTATRGGRPLSDQISSLGFLIQHTRLQLLSPTIRDEFKAFGIDEYAAATAIHRMGLAHVSLSKRIDELSVGQQRRVGMATLFARRCPVVILDEPMAGLDQGGRTTICRAVEALPPTTSVITVTHDVDISAPLGRDVIELESGRVNGTHQL